MTRSGDGGLPMPWPVEVVLTALKNAVVFVSDAGINVPSLLHLSAMAMARIGLRTLAAHPFDWALHLADRSTNRRLFLVRQGWEFAAERNRFLLGEARVQDPLFQVGVVPDPGGRAGTRRWLAPGYYEVRVTQRGLRIDGYLRPGTATDVGAAPAAPPQLEVLIDGNPIRRTSTTAVIPGMNVMVVHIQRDALAALPTSARLSVRLAGGEPLLFRGCAETRLTIPHGGKIAIEGTGVAVGLDKKGFLLRDGADTADLQRGFLEIYAAASRFFDDELKTPLFVLYGTLLGQHRGGDFIPGDDDFDVGYWSDATTSAAVRDEGMDFVVRLVRAGFVVTLNRAGRLFRLRLPGMAPACHLDVHAVWRERGSLWIHPCANLDCGRDDFLPARRARMRDVEVTVPARPEAFLSAYYGAGWRVPDPAYSTAARAFPHWKTRLLRRSCVTPALVRDMQRRLGEPAHGSNGLLIAIGSQSIYPLERYQQLCDW